jgi:hypothetical protein
MSIHQEISFETEICQHLAEKTVGFMPRGMRRATTGSGRSIR